jgi:hypothetical protein
MEIQTEVRSDPATDKDRELMETVLKKVHQRKLFIYFPLTIICIAGISFINMFDIRFDLNENFRGIGNAVFVIGGALPLRLAIGEIISYSKDLSNFQIKIARGPIRDIEGKTITLGKYEFSMASLPEVELKAGDNVELKAGYKTSSVFWIQKI